MHDTFHIHPVDLLLSTMARIVAPLAIIGGQMQWPAVIAFALLSTVIGLAHHSDTKLAHWASLGFVPGRVYATYHLLHHKRPGINFGGAYWFWDKLLGTAV